MAGLTEYKLVLLLLLGMEKASMSIGNYLSILPLIALLLLDLLKSKHASDETSLTGQWRSV